MYAKYNIFARKHWALFVLILFHLASNSVWIYLNTTPPPYDANIHTARSMEFAHKLLHLSWDQSFLTISRYYPPLTYVLASVFAIVGNFDIKVLQWFSVVIFCFSLGLLYLLAYRISRSQATSFVAAFIYSFFLSIFTEARYLMTDGISICILLCSVYLLLFDFDQSLLRGRTYLITLFISLGMLSRWTFIVYILPFIGWKLWQYWTHQHTFSNDSHTHRDQDLKVLVGSLTIFIGITAPWYLANISSILHIANVTITPEFDDPKILLSLDNVLFYIRQLITFQFHTIPSLLYISIVIYWVFKKITLHRAYILLFAYVLCFCYIAFTFFIGNKNVRFVTPVLPFAAISIALMSQGLIKRSSFVALLLIPAMYYGLVTYTILSFAWPFYPDFKYIIQVPVYGYADLVYLSTYPLRSLYSSADWKNDEVVKSIIDEKARLPTKVTLNYLVLTDKQFFSAASIKSHLYQTQRGVPKYIEEADTDYFRLSPSGRFENVPNLDAYLSQISLVIYTRDSLGNPDTLRDSIYRVQMKEYIEDLHPDWYQLIKEISLPDGDVVKIVRRV